MQWFNYSLFLPFNYKKFIIQEPQNRKAKHRHLQKDRHWYEIRNIRGRHVNGETERNELRTHIRFHHVSHLIHLSHFGSVLLLLPPLVVSTWSLIYCLLRCGLSSLWPFIGQRFCLLIIFLVFRFHWFPQIISGKWTNNYNTYRLNYCYESSNWLWIWVGPEV